MLRPVLELLDVLKPTDLEAGLLAACLRDGESARTGWTRWRRAPAARKGSELHRLARYRRLLPLLDPSIDRNNLDAEPDVRAYVRALALREELRSTRVIGIAAEVLFALQTADVDATVVRGVALAATAYPAPALRHCHDLDLLVQPNDLDAARRAVQLAGASATNGSGGRLVLQHASGLRIALHTRPFCLDYPGTAAPILRGRQVARIGGGRAAVLAPEAAFVHVLAHAACCASRRSLQWVADAWYVFHAAPTFDWHDVLERSATSGVRLAIYPMLQFLKSFGVAVPDHVFSALIDDFGASSPLEEDLALGAATASMQGDVLRMLRRTSTWRGRLRLARWLIAPSPDYMRTTFSGRRSGALSVSYLYRPVRFLAGRIGARAVGGPAMHGT